MFFLNYFFIFAKMTYLVKLMCSLKKLRRWWRASWTLFCSRIPSKHSLFRLSGRQFLITMKPSIEDRSWKMFDYIELLNFYHRLAGAHLYLSCLFESR
jgi:hypothetical protein